MNSAVQKIAVAQEAISQGDLDDARRMVGCAAMITTMPAIASPAARDLAIVQLRRLADNHPRFAELYDDIIRHIESYQT